MIAPPKIQFFFKNLYYSSIFFQKMQDKFSKIAKLFHLCIAPKMGLDNFHLFLYTKHRC